MFRRLSGVIAALVVIGALAGAAVAYAASGSPSTPSTPTPTRTELGTGGASA